MTDEKVYVQPLERMPLRMGERGRTNGIYLLTNYVLTDKFCVELMLIWQGSRNFYVLTRIMYSAGSYYMCLTSRVTCKST